MFEISTHRRDEFIDAWAPWIVRRGLSTAAIFLLEAHKPLAGIGAHAILAFRPLVNAVLPVDAASLAAFVRDPDNIEMLIRRVEQLDQEQRQRRKG